MRNALTALAVVFGLALACTAASAAPVGSLAAGKAAAGNADIIKVGNRWRGGPRYYGRGYGRYYGGPRYLAARNWGWTTRSYGYYPSPGVYYNAPIYYYGAPGVLYTPGVRYYAVPPPVVVYERGYYDGYGSRGYYARY